MDKTDFNIENYDIEELAAILNISNFPINESKVDFTWRPDPLDTEPFIYIWGSKWAPAEQVPIMEYHVPGNDGTIKYIDTPVELAVDMSTWEVLEEIEDGSFDFTWRPDPNETELFNYVFVL